jgi:curli biogenesis system outer membrane secretion channel CsgG
MKIVVALMILIHSSLTYGGSSPKIPVSVSAFENKSATSYSPDSSCHYWGWFSNLGEAFGELLIESLHSYPKFEVLERQQIQRIYENEVDLVNSDDKTLKKGGFKKARITFVGVVDGFEFCEGSTGGSLDVGSLLGLGNITPSVRKSQAAVSLLLRAIDTASGRVLATSRSKKTQSSTSLGLDFSVEGVSAQGNDFKQSMLGETIREAIDEATSELVRKLH